ncbi:NYN domain-containing protein [Vibrio owensii]|uniref:NYN domain-containing protein n=1 Tax=Vibrio owensii TaxID=696485 RepID=UPI0018F1D008|nr:NYN domain-containing protein [Vibrio owensii]
MGKAIIFFDTDNVSTKLVEHVLKTVRKKHDIANIYAIGLLTGCSEENWRTALTANAKSFFLTKIESRSKNSADLAISFEAGKAMKRTSITDYYFVSDDLDFTVIIKLVRLNGKKAHRLGSPQYKLAIAKSESSKKKEKQKLVVNRTLSKNEKQLQSDIIKAMSLTPNPKNGWFKLAVIGQHLSNNAQLKRVKNLKRKATNLGSFEVKDCLIRINPNEKVTLASEPSQPSL